MKFVKIKEGLSAPAGGNSDVVEVPSSEVLFLSHTVGSGKSGTPASAIQGSINNSDFGNLPSGDILNGVGNATIAAGVTLRARAYPYMRVINVGAKSLEFDVYAILDLEDE